MHLIGVFECYVQWTITGRIVIKQHVLHNYVWEGERERGGERKLIKVRQKAVYEPGDIVVCVHVCVFVSSCL